MGYMNSQYRSVAPAQIEQRQVYRHPVMLQRASVRKHAAKSHEAQLVDLSIYGCRVSTDALFDPGDRLWLRFESGAPVAASAVWSKGGELGCRFDEALDRALFRELTLLTE